MLNCDIGATARLFRSSVSVSGRRSTSGKEGAEATENPLDPFIDSCEKGVSLGPWKPFEEDP